MNLYPYLRGWCPRETLGAIWLAIEQAGDWEHLFWWEDDVKDGPITTKGDLVDLINFVHDPTDPKIILVGEDFQQIVGVTWFNRIKGDTAEGGIWVAPKFRGARSRQLMLDSLAFVKAHHDIKRVLATTPWAICRNLCRRCGFIESSPSLSPPYDVGLRFREEEDSEYKEREQGGRSPLYHLVKEL